MGETHPSQVTIECPYGLTRRIRSVLIANREVLRTSAEALRIAAIKSGDLLTEVELNALVHESEPEAAMNRSLRLLGHRERSRAELAARLHEDGYPIEVAGAVLDRLAGFGYLDDGRFALDLIRSKHGAGWGRRRIEKVLSEKGVDPDISGPILDEYAPLEDEATRAAALIAHLDLATRATQEKALRRLVSKGFSYEVVRSAIREAQTHQAEDREGRDS